MNKKSIIAIFLGIAILSLSCYHDDGDARVTIRFKGNFMASNAKPQKHFIDRILELFSTPAYAWDPNCYKLTLTVSGPDIDEEIEFENNGQAGSGEPIEKHTFTLDLPAVNNVTFKVTSDLSIQSDIPHNWGGSTTVSLKPGKQDITITMIAITQITYGTVDQSGYYSFDFDAVVDRSHCSGYKIYRSTNNPDGNYKHIKTINNDAYNFQDDDSLDPYENYYYYRISVLNKEGKEGLLSEPYRWHCVP